MLDPVTIYDLWKGRRLLERLLPEAERLAAGMEAGGFEAGTPIGRSQMPWMRIDNVDLCHLYRGPSGGWYCDFVLQEAGPGGANVFGSPEAHPFAQRDNALDFAVHTLAALIAATKTPTPTPDAEDDQAISFYGTWITPPLELFAAIRQAAADLHFVDGRDEDDLRAHLTALRTELWPHTAAAEDNLVEIDHQALAALSHEAQARLLVVLACARVKGIFRHPIAKPGRTYEEEMPNWVARMAARTTRHD